MLLAGATGNVGGEVLSQLSAAGHAVRAMVRNPSKAADLAGPKVELVQADFDRPESLEAALAGADKAFVATPVDARHVEWMKAFYLGAKHANVRHVVKLSGMGAADDSPSQIILMHAETDRLLRGSGLGYTILQPNSFYQNLLGMAATIRTQDAFYLPMGEARQSLIDIRDIAAVAVRCLL